VIQRLAHLLLKPEGEDTKKAGFAGTNTSNAEIIMQI